MNGRELQLHPHRLRAIEPTERWLVCLFLRRYVVWCARRRQIEGLRHALDLLTEIAATREPPRSASQDV